MNRPLADNMGSPGLVTGGRLGNNALVDRLAVALETARHCASSRDVSLLWGINHVAVTLQRLALPRGGPRR